MSMNENRINIRQANSEEFPEIGELLVKVYSSLEGFPSKEEQPEYYEMLLNIGQVSRKPCTELLVAVSDNDEVLGAVVYFSDMSYYGSGGSATKEKNASGFRLLAVDPKFRGLGVGKKIVQHCILKTIRDGNKELIIHSTEFMKIAWKMYKTLGFKRSEDLDFIQKELPVFGFRLKV